MSRITIKQIIQELTQCYILGYEIPEEPVELAKGYWDLRDDNEIVRDAKAGVTYEDYQIWVKTAIADYQTNLILQKFN